VSAPVAQKLRATLPQARVVEFAASGHAPFLDDSARFNALLDQWQCGTVVSAR
jgi:pimeloyl-ACP methyl ester carboxylesterase